MEPKVKRYMPRATVTQKNANIELLEVGTQQKRYEYGYLFYPLFFSFKSKLTWNEPEFQNYIHCSNVLQATETYKFLEEKGQTDGIDISLKQSLLELVRRKFLSLRVLCPISMKVQKSIFFLQICYHNELAEMDEDSFRELWGCAGGVAPNYFISFIFFIGSWICLVMGKSMTSHRGGYYSLLILLATPSFAIGVGHL